MFDFFLAPELSVFLTIGTILVVLAGLEIMSAFVGPNISSLFEAIIPDFDIDVLSWLGVGKLPVYFIIINYLLSVFLIGMITQYVIFHGFGVFVPTWIMTPVAFVTAVFPTTVLNTALRKILPSDETYVITEDDFIGRTAIVTIGKATAGNPAPARFTDFYGQEHSILVEPRDTDTIFPEGSTVTIEAKKSDKTFYVI